MQLSKVYLVHERANEEDSAPGAAEKVFGRQGVGKRVGVEALALVGDSEDKGRAGIFKAEGDLLGGVVLITVEHGVNGRFPHRHGDVEALVIVEAGLFGQFIRSGFHFRHAVHGGAERDAAPDCPGRAQGFMTRLDWMQKERMPPWRLLEPSSKFHLPARVVSSNKWVSITSKLNGAGQRACLGGRAGGRSHADGYLETEQTRQCGRAPHPGSA